MTDDNPNIKKLGATGQFPDGKITSDDEGELRMAVVADSEKGQTTIYFGKPVAWIAMSPDEADMLADALKDKAQIVRNDLATMAEVAQNDKTH